MRIADCGMNSIRNADFGLRNGLNGKATECGDVLKPTDAMGMKRFLRVAG